MAVLITIVVSAGLVYMLGQSRRCLLWVVTGYGLLQALIIFLELIGILETIDYEYTIYPFYCYGYVARL